ncbi:MAG: hypothetical protein NT023_23350, partial [Armatimonadetes bacterium]|nr:hypothetical protein [Armatimonadota bacterium]
MRSGASKDVFWGDQGIFKAYKRLNKRSALKFLTDQYLQDRVVSPQQRADIRALCKQKNLRFQERQVIIWLLKNTSHSTEVSSVEEMDATLCSSLTQYSIFENWISLLLKTYILSIVLYFLVVLYAGISSFQHT